MDAFERATPLVARSEAGGAAVGGRVARAASRAAGLGRGAVHTAVRAGRLRRVHRGVYAVGHTVLRPEGHRLAAVLACGPGAVLSHRSAAAHWELLATSQERIDVTAPRSRHGVPGIRLHTLSFPRCPGHHQPRGHPDHDGPPHPARPGGNGARRPARTRARAGHVPPALRPARHRRRHRPLQRPPRNPRPEGGDQTGAADHQERCGRSGCSGSSAARTSPSRSATRRCTPPTTASACPTSTGPAYDLIVETDGWEAHRTLAAFRSDRAKDAALTAAGYKVLRFTWDVDDATILRRLKSLLQN